MLETLFEILMLAVVVLVPGYAAIVRGRTYAIFAGVILLLSLPGVWFSHAHLAALVGGGLRESVHGIFALSIACAGLHLTHLVRARLRGRTFRLFVSVPGQVTIAAGFMAGGWLLLLLPVRGVLLALGETGWVRAMGWLDLLPFAVAVASIATSRLLPDEVVRLRLDAARPAEIERASVERYRLRHAPALDERPLRIVQISDPHLGPWQSVRALRETVSHLLSHEPDLVLLTGDYLTMEGNGTPGALAEAFAPLRDYADRSYAIFGNHDHEAPEVVREALARNDVRLLVDEAVALDTQGGRVQLIGADYVGRGRREHLETLLAAHPRLEDHFRLLLLHDPLGFNTLPPDSVDLVLSGHTHGGQVGLVSLGSDWTVLSRTRWPDHGLFALGSNRLYVHRGTGFYGFPLRVGVPGERSVLEVLRA